MYVPVLVCTQLLRTQLLIVFTSEPLIKGLGQKTDKQTTALNKAICKAKEYTDENLYDAAE